MSTSAHRPGSRTQIADLRASLRNVREKPKFDKPPPAPKRPSKGAVDVAIERAEKADDPSALAGVALALPALARAEKIQKRAARVGFDWDDIEDVRNKILEEIEELSEAVKIEHVEEEVGDLLFATVNLARHRGVDPEAALRAANLKFERRFRAMEDLAGGSFPDLGLKAQEALWQVVKRGEKAEG